MGNFSFLFKFDLLTLFLYIEIFTEYSLYIGANYV
jgi:hypothetical protein